MVVKEHDFDDDKEGITEGPCKSRLTNFRRVVLEALKFWRLRDIDMFPLRICPREC